jgi:hypothetical protein
MSLDNKTDIEANFSTIVENTSITNTYVTNKLNITSSASSDDQCGIYCLKFTAIFLFLLFGLPLVFCDLYYAYNDNSCVNSHVDRISINLKEYLLVSGLLTGCLLFIIILGIMLFNENSKQTLLYLAMVIFIFASIFNTAWNIIGGVIFWGYMDNSLCSNNVFNYVFASLIIKYVFAVFGILSNNKEKK